jgi:hypothetical protein
MSEFDALGRALHLKFTPLLGTARHLRDVHGFAEAAIDSDDYHGMAHDHAVIHGATVDADGRWRFGDPS